MGTTLLLCIPACHYLWKAPTTRQFLLSLFCVSMIFFMFGFQVHEKQILSPALIFALLFVEMTPFLAIFAYVTSFSMLMLYTNDLNYINYFALQFATIIFGREFEALVNNDFNVEVENNESEEEIVIDSDEQKSFFSWENLLSLPVFMFLRDELKPENPHNRHLTKLGKTIRYYRNELCTVVFLGSLLFHYLDNAYPPPEELPDLYRVLNNVLCLGFFTLILLYAHL